MATTITVELDRDSIDPQGIGSDEDLASCREYVLDAVKTAFPGADVREVRSGGRTSGLDGERDISRDVKEVVNQAFDAWCAQA